MTSTEIATCEPQRVGLSNEQLRYIARTEFVPPGLRGNLPAILACVATGRELGIGDMVALKSIHIIDGKASYSAELMVQLVRARGHSISGEVTDGSAVLKGTRADNGDSMTCEWTLQMAERAGLTGKQNWKRYPEAMLWARAVSQLCRMLFADCFAGKTYVPEEIEDADLLDDGNDSSDERAVSHSEEEGPRSPTPAEGGSDDQAPEMGARTPEPSYATEKQRKFIFAKAHEHGVDEPTLRAILAEFTGQDSTAKIPRDRVDVIVEAIGLQQAAV
jgi:hypothetical protein